MDKRRGFLTALIIGLIILAALFLINIGIPAISGNSVKDITFEDKNLGEFVSCLNEKNVKLYGIGDKSNLGYQSAIFGNYFSEINYIDCAIESEKCTGVIIYPTWEIKGRPVHGTTLSLEVLSTLSGCDI